MQELYDITDIKKQLETTNSDTFNIISEKNKYTLYNFPSSPNLQQKTITYTSNGIKDLVPDDGYEGISQAKINIIVPQQSLQEKTITYTTRGTQTLLPDTNYDGISKATININVPQPVFNEITANISDNGTYNYTPSPSTDGISKVTINVNVLQYFIDKLNCYYLNTSHIQNLREISTIIVYGPTTESDIKWTNRWGRFIGYSDTASITLSSSWAFIIMWKGSDNEAYIQLQRSTSIPIRKGVLTWVHVLEEDTSTVILRCMDSSKNDRALFVSYVEEFSEPRDFIDLYFFYHTIFK
ncbi:hypothetical protein EDI_113900 [Entamoeba dispar SAW760]|uniref:Uncharacterized protein n=1 Tax=Entamoeba dispar (strain ATCC PRA-260 / SAW760) TaxID=370354 RepID=B0EEV7_ENTDS|nr:uncharacterized protein EDI_113900 [Entamoeba dispar SAW760]EDR26933.1 hypothetical protein EDI_113900 [Entamoeba dispar SAW760]|eukprot:EDR26933.1 hypothetical protein EDI_113900 [Entamoeba dispar SAW760]